MYIKVFETARKEIEITKSIIEMHEKLRSLQAQATEKESIPPLFEELVQALPSGRGTWDIYDHCSVITRLYSIYESFVETLIHDWIDRLSTIVPEYSQLYVLLCQNWLATKH